MTKETGQVTGQADIKIAPIENCRFAYTINNMQPVLCSWISDQPLFFNDADIIEEDDILDDPIFQALEKDIAALRHKTGAYEKISASFAEAEGVKLSRFAEDAAFVAAPFKSNKESSLVSALEQSRFATLLMSFAKTHNVSIQESLQVADAFYDREGAVVLVRSDLELGTKILLASRELRKVWQHRNGAGLHPLMLHPDHAVLVNRAQLADMTISMIRIAWELQLAGVKEAWARVENSTMADLGRAFAREACSDFRSLNSGKAAIACFESWFLSERCRKADRTLIQQMLADYQGYVFADNAEASRAVTIDMMSALGKVPFGQNYLSKSVNQIMADTVFTEVRDRSNANFLWFIKFERSFRNGEEEIQSQSEKTSGKSSVRTTKLTPKEKPKPSAEIIPMPVRVSTKETKRAVNGQSGDIVLFLPPIE